MNLSVYKQKLNDLTEKKNNNEMKRYGTIFSTQSNTYYYDTGTGKVFKLDDSSFYIINSILNDDDYLPRMLLHDKLVSNKEVIKLLDLITSEHLFELPMIDKLSFGISDEIIKYKINNNMEQLILKLTDRCNLRCKYCIYQEGNLSNRDFSNNDMNEETAFKITRYFLEKSSDEASITFYGGEPLLKYNLMKKIIEYCRKTYPDKNLTYSFTTNGTLVTDEMAKYFSEIDGLSILCSIDGPEHVHDDYRVFENGLGSFHASHKGLTKLLEVRQKNNIAINAVFAPPYNYSKIDSINKYFTFINDKYGDVNIQIGYPSEGSLNSEEYFSKIRDNPIYSFESGMDPLEKWRRNLIYEKGLDIKSNNVITSGVNYRLLKINDRYLSEKPGEINNFNGCCIPAVRRLYAETNGEFYLCERIGISPCIGNVNEGIDFSIIKNEYIDNFANKFSKACNNCWAVRLCGMCYIGRMDNFGVKNDYDFRYCDYEREFIKSDLEFYHELLEKQPNNLKFLNNMKTK